MRIFANKSEAEKKKIIAAIVLGVLAIGSLLYTFGGILISKRSQPITPRNTSSAPLNSSKSQTTPLEQSSQIVNQSDIESEWLTTPVSYNPSAFLAPEAGHNIFAFYEPPPPTPYQPTPTPEMPTPKPTPTPPLVITSINPQTVYAGTRSLRLEVNGGNFTPSTYIFWNGSQLPTIFVSPQKLIADIPSALLATEGAKQIEVRSGDGKLYSLPSILTVQPAPVPQFKYIGLIARRSYNNDTAYFQQQDQTPFGARLGDIVGNRFRVVSISSKEVVLEDVELGFRHRLPLTQSTDTNSTRRNEVPPGFPPDAFIAPPVTTPNPPQQEVIPGIPPNIPRYVPPNQRKKQEKSDDEDDEDGNR